MKPQGKPPIKRSSLHQKLMPDELLLQAFGKLNPTTAERTMYFFDAWCDSKHHSYKLDYSDLVNNKTELRGTVKDVCAKLGFLPLWDYQVKGTEIRFKHAEDLAMFIISWKEHG